MSRQTTEFGKKCRSYRAELGMNMTQLAEKTGKRQSIITKIEQGDYPLSLEYIMKSIEIYGIKEKPEQMKFLMSCFRSIDMFDIPVKELGDLRKEWLAAIFIFGDVRDDNDKGWAELLNWIKDFSDRLKQKRLGYVTSGGSPI